MRWWMGSLAGLLVVSAGCGLGEGTNCTLIGCGTGGTAFRIVGADGEELEPGVYSGSLTLDGEETSFTCDTTKAPEGCDYDSDAMVIASFGPAREIQVDLTYVATSYVLTVTPPSGDPVTREGELEYVESTPNGPGCGVCSSIEEPTVITLEP